MLEWVKDKAKQATDFVRQFSDHRALIASLLELPEGEMQRELQQRLAAMDAAAVTSMIAAVTTASAAALFKVQRLAPQWASQHEAARPRTLPDKPEARAAVERLYKLEAIARHVYARSRGEVIPAPPAEVAPLSRAALQPSVDALLRQLRATLDAGGRWAECNEFFTKLEEFRTRLPESERSPETDLILCRAFLDGAAMSRAYTPPEFGHLIAATEGVVHATEKAILAAQSNNASVGLSVSAQLRKHLKTMNTLFTAQVSFAPQLKDDPYAKLLALYFSDVGRALLNAEDLSDTGASQDADEHRRLFDRYTSAMLVFADDTITDQRLHTHEEHVCRPLAIEAQTWLHRNHVFLARPAFPTPAIDRDPNGLFYSGSDAVRAVIAKGANVLGLRFVEGARYDNPIHGRWNELRAAHIGVFDFTGYSVLDDRGTLDASQEDELLAAAAPAARVAYELGWAYALGVPMLVVQCEGQALPFDVDVQAHTLLSGNTPNVPLEPLWRTMYSPQRTGAGTSVPETVDFVREQFSTHGAERVRKAAALIASTDFSRDATRLRDQLEGLTSDLGADAPTLLLPAFPGRYPTAPALFYACAFRDWAKPAQQMARAVCAAERMVFRIGYERIQEDIIRAIWEDVCTSTHVLVDITNLNTNAVQELGMAQAVGRRVLVITQNRAPHAYFPAIAKIRTHLYDPANPSSMASLRQVIDAFVTSSLES